MRPCRQVAGRGLRLAGVYRDDAPRLCLDDRARCRRAAAARSSRSRLGARIDAGLLVAALAYAWRALFQLVPIRSSPPSHPHDRKGAYTAVPQMTAHRCEY